MQLRARPEAFPGGAQRCYGWLSAQTYAATAET